MKLDPSGTTSILGRMCDLGEHFAVAFAFEGDGTIPYVCLCIFHGYRCINTVDSHALGHSVYHLLVYSQWLVSAMPFV